MLLSQAGLLFILKAYNCRQAPLDRHAPTTLSTNKQTIVILTRWPHNSLCVLDTVRVNLSAIAHAGNDVQTWPLSAVILDMKMFVGSLQNKLFVPWPLLCPYENLIPGNLTACKSSLTDPIELLASVYCQSILLIQSAVLHRNVPGNRICKCKSNGDEGPKYSQ